MRNDCKVVGDLIPLYLEGILSEESASFVEEHLKTCEQCRKEFEKMKEAHKDEAVFTDMYSKEALPIKKIKRKLYFRNIIIAVVAVVLTLGCLFAYDQLKPVKLDFGTSEIYTEEDMIDASMQIEKQFDLMKGFKLYSITYEGDEVCQKELEDCNSLAEPGTVYTECIVFRTDFRTPLFGNRVLSNYQRYNWGWYLARTADGDWDLLTWGAP